MIFKNQALQYVLRALERKYNVSITDESGVSDMKLTEMVKEGEEVEAVLQRISTAANLQFEKKNDTSFILKAK